MTKENTISVSQTYELTNGCYNWTPLMCNIVGVIIYHISAKDENRNEVIFGAHSTDEYGHHVLDIPVKTLHGEIEGINKVSRDYEAIKKAVIELWKNPIKIKHNNGKFEMMQIITHVTNKIQGGKVRIKVDGETWEFLRRTDQYTKFNIIQWLSLKSYYSKRIVLLAKAWTKPMKYNAETLLSMFDLPKTYLVRHLASKILDTAKEELDKKGEVTFNYKPIFDPNQKNGRPKITGYLMWQIKKEEPQNTWIFSENLMIKKMNKEGYSEILDEDTITNLLHIGFRPEEIKTNIFTLYHICLRYNIKNLISSFDEELENLEQTSNISFENPKGYYIKRMKNILQKEEKYQ